MWNESVCLWVEQKSNRLPLWTLMLCIIWARWGWCETSSTETTGVVPRDVTRSVGCKYRDTGSYNNITLRKIISLLILFHVKITEMKTNVHVAQFEEQLLGKPDFLGSKPGFWTQELWATMSWTFVFTISPEGVHHCHSYIFHVRSSSRPRTSLL